MDRHLSARDTIKRGNRRRIRSPVRGEGEAEAAFCGDSTGFPPCEAQTPDTTEID